MAKLWCEARCDYFGISGADSAGYPACHETAPGAFGEKNGAALARAHGWRVIDKRWCCPACLPHVKKFVKSKKDLTR